MEALNPEKSFAEKQFLDSFMSAGTSEVRDCATCSRSFSECENCTGCQVGNCCDCTNS